jgi:hypothetical protein
MGEAQKPILKLLFLRNKRLKERCIIRAGSHSPVSLWTLKQESHSQCPNLLGHSRMEILKSCTTQPASIMRNFSRLTKPKKSREESPKKGLGKGSRLWGTQSRHELEWSDVNEMVNCADYKRKSSNVAAISR